MGSQLRNGLDFHQYILGQAGYLDGGAGGVGFLEELGIDFVHGGEIIHIVEKHGGLDDRTHVGPGGIEDGFDVVEGLPGLGLDASLGDGAGGGIYGDLAGGEQEIADLDGLRVGADRGRGVLGVDGLFHGICSFPFCTQYRLGGFFYCSIGEEAPSIISRWSSKLSPHAPGHRSQKQDVPAEVEPHQQDDQGGQGTVDQGVPGGHPNEPGEQHGAGHQGCGGQQGGEVQGAGVAAEGEGSSQAVDSQHQE